MGKKRLTRLKLDFISAVDRPAQEPATVAILKRKDGDVTNPKNETKHAFVKRLMDEGKIDGEAKASVVEKATILTTEMDGHTHLVYTGRFDGGEDKAGQTSWNDEHTHPWIRDEEGNVVIGAADGHTHDTAIITKQDPTKETDPMTTKKTDDTKSPEVVALEKKLATARAESELNDVQKAHYAELGDKAKPAFLAKSSDERDAEIAKAKAEDDVVYKSADGTKYRASDDPRMVQLAKDRDTDRIELAKERGARRDAEYAKRADDELSHVPGDTATKVAMLKAIDEITDEETRTKALESLKSADNGIGEALKTRGVTVQTSKAADPHAQIETLAREHASKHNVTFEKAYTAVLDTPEGRELYAKHAELNPTK